MKKIMLAVGLLVTTTCIFSQDLKKVRTVFTLSQFPNAGADKLEDAKKELDKLLQDPKSAALASTLLMKAEIYGSIAGNPTLFAKYPTANVEAWEALKKYLSLEADAKSLKDDNYVGLNEIYRSFFGQGVKEYNAKNYDMAFEKWKQVVEVSDLMISRKWSNISFDTTAYLYAGVSAQNAKKDAEAAKFYSALASQKIPGADYEGVYDYLVRYYLNTKNEADFQKYNTIAKSLYPKSENWNELEFTYTTKNSDLPAIEKTFKTQDEGGKLSANNYFDYGNFFVNDKRIKEMEGATRNDYTKRATYAFSKSYQLDSTNLLAAYNTAVTYYATWEADADAARAIKGTTADIKAKRATADKVADASADKTIEWMERAYSKLAAKSNRSAVERASLNKSIDLLFGLYNYKRDRSKVINPKDYDKYDAKMKLYDGLHNKY